MQISNKMLDTFIQMGCNRMEAAIALQVYTELCEVKKLRDVQYNYNKYIECLYFTGTKKNNTEKMVFVPLPAVSDLSFELMHKYLCLSQEDNKCVCLVLCSPDSTCVYYNVSDGLIPPNNAPLHKTKHNSAIMENILRKNRKMLEQGAMYGVPVNLQRNTSEVVKHDSDEFSD